MSRLSWYEGLSSKHLKVLTGSFLGWIFDGYETFALIFAIVPALLTLLPKNQLSSIPYWAGVTIGMTLLGWGIGGIIGSTITDYIGRKRMMTIAILGYSLFTGITSISQNVWQLTAFRILTGLFIGSEWSTGIALLTETWPDRARPKGAGFLQSGFGWGAFLASIAWLLIAPLGPQSWRYMFLVGIIPAIFILYIRSQMDESERWRTAVRERRWAATETAESTIGEKLRVSEKRPFSMAEVFRESESRRYVVLTFLMSLSIIIGWWAVSTLIPRYGAVIAGKEGYSNLAYWIGIIGLVYNAGGIIAYMSGGFVADLIGRKPLLMLTFVGSLVMDLVTFLVPLPLVAFTIVTAINGFFTLGFAFVWMAIYLPELFTSSVRSTAIGFVFNASRLIAFVFPIIAGILITTLGGISSAAVLIGLIYVLGIIVTPLVPETKGKRITI